MGRSSTRRFSGQMKAGARCSRTREILPIQLTRENFPVNSLLFTGERRFALPSVVLASERGTCRNWSRLTRQQTEPCRAVYLPPVLVLLRNHFPQTKPTSANEANGKTIVKTVFEHEQHNTWPNEPGQSANGERAGRACSRFTFPRHRWRAAGASRSGASRSS
jgi:hypothetical protein